MDESTPTKAWDASAAWKNRNRDHVREYAKAYREKNREYFKRKKRESYHKAMSDPNRAAVIKEKKKKAREENRDEMIAYLKQWRENNAEKLRQQRKENSAKRVAAARKWQLENPEHYAAKQEEWKKNNKHILRKHVALYRARLVGATIGDPKKIAEWERGWRSKETAQCYWCLRHYPIKECESDHVEPLILGGPHCLENLVIACRKCNNKKRAKPLDKWLDIVSRDDWPTH